MISGCMQPSAFNDLISFYKSREVVGTPCLLGSKYKSFKFIEVLPQLCIWSATTNLHAIKKHFDCIAIIYAQPVVTFILDF